MLAIVAESSRTAFFFFTGSVCLSLPALSLPALSSLEAYPREIIHLAVTVVSPKMKLIILKKNEEREEEAGGEGMPTRGPDQGRLFFMLRDHDMSRAYMQLF